MSELKLLSDEELVIRLHKEMNRHDSLVDSVPMGDERIYFAGKAVESIKAEQQRRGYKCCPKCFDFGEVTDMHGDTYGFCDCAFGIHFQAEAESRAARRKGMEEVSHG